MHALEAEWDSGVASSVSRLQRLVGNQAVIILLVRRAISEPQVADVSSTTTSCGDQTSIQTHRYSGDRVAAVADRRHELSARDLREFDRSLLTCGSQKASFTVRLPSKVAVVNWEPSHE